MGLQLFSPPTRENRRFSSREIYLPKREGKRVQSVPSCTISNTQTFHDDSKNHRRYTAPYRVTKPPNIHRSNSQLSEEGRNDSYYGHKRPFNRQRVSSRQSPVTPVLPQIEPCIEPLLQAHIIDNILVSHSAFSDSPTLIKQERNQSISSSTTEPHSFPVLPHQRSLSLEYPEYYHSSEFLPRIPPAIISRAEYPSSIDTQSSQFLECSTALEFQDKMVIEQSKHENLGELWDFANGTRAPDYQGKRFCLKMTSVATEDPIYMLSSPTQAFYSLKLNLRSDTTKISMIRYDPNKNARVSLLGFSKLDRGIEVLSSTLQESAHHFPPNDGLVAVLYPKAASKFFIENASKISMHAKNDDYIATVENECGRLVWDGDSGSYYLVHSAMRLPFSITLSSSPGSSTVKYMLEHPELPRDIVTLIKDSNGSGYLEIDTSCAAKVASSYIIDVAVFALMLVALAEEIAIGPVELSNKYTPKSNRTSLMNNGADQSQTPQRKVERENIECRSTNSDLDLERQGGVGYRDEKRRKSYGILDWFRMLVMRLIHSITIIFGYANGYTKR
ncbi:hypothetical protein K3495_g7303 [Podosphaera aphanis]|nr:hypothetical protein K3495_g7303 [Podosphaera aphanis]